MTDYIPYTVVLLLAGLAGAGIGRWWALVLVVLVPLSAPLYAPYSDAPAWSGRLSSSARPF